MLSVFFTTIKCIAICFYILIVANNDACGQVKPKLPGNGSRYKTTKTGELFQFLCSNKYNNLKEPFVWIIDAAMQPVRNAQIIISDGKGFTDTTTGGSEDGIYFIKSIRPGIYKVKVTAAGYAEYIRHIQVYQDAIVSCRVVMGKKDDIYLPTAYGPVPLIDAVETVHLQWNIRDPKDYENPDQRERLLEMFQKEINQLKVELDMPDTLYKYGNYITWPTDSAKRVLFKKRIKESTLLKTSLLNLTGGAHMAGAMTPSGIYWIRRDADETIIRAMFWKYNFRIETMMENRFLNANQAYWEIRATYAEPLSFDYLRDIKQLNDQLPLFFIEIDSIVGAELTR